MNRQHLLLALTLCVSCASSQPSPPQPQPTEASPQQDLPNPTSQASQTAPFYVEVSDWLRENPTSVLISEHEGEIYVNGNHMGPIVLGGEEIAKLAARVKKAIPKGKEDVLLIVSPTLDYLHLVNLLFMTQLAGSMAEQIAIASQRFTEESASFLIKSRVNLGFWDWEEYRVYVTAFDTPEGHIVRIGREALFVHPRPGCAPEGPAFCLKQGKPDVDGLRAFLTELRAHVAPYPLGFLLVGRENYPAESSVFLAQQMEDVVGPVVFPIPMAEDGPSVETERIFYAKQPPSALSNIPFSEKLETAGSICAQERVQQAMNAHTKDIDACFHAAFADNPALQGRWVLSWIINSTEAQDLKITERPVRSNEGVETCLKQVVASTKFEPGDGYFCVVNQPFEFKPEAP